MTSPGVVDTIAAGEVALSLAGVLPGVMREHGKRVRKVRIEVV